MDERGDAELQAAVTLQVDRGVGRRYLERKNQKVFREPTIFRLFFFTKRR